VYQSYLAYANISSILGYTSIAAKYFATATSVANNINKQFLDLNTGVYRDTQSGGFNATECGQSLPLFLQIAPTSSIPAISAMLEAIAVRNKHNFQVGGFGIKCTD
jgi:hypothetical protein